MQLRLSKKVASEECEVTLKMYIYITDNEAIASKRLLAEVRALYLIAFCNRFANFINLKLSSLFGEFFKYISNFKCNRINV